MTGNCATRTMCHAGLLVAAVALTLEAQIVNGSFETGDFRGWRVEEAPGGQVNVNCGAWGLIKDGLIINPGDQVWDFADGGYAMISTPGLPATFTATEGRFATVQLQGCPLTTRRLSQVVTLAAGAATLRWDMRYTNHHGVFIEGQQDIQVTVRDATTGAVFPAGTIYRTTEGLDPQVVSAMSPFSADVSAFAGQRVSIAFDLNARVNQTPFKGIDAAIDHVRIHDAGGAEIPGDNDADGVLDDLDNCRRQANPAQVDFDGDGVGDSCDNCREVVNANQADADLDGVGDLCESDRFTDGDVYFLARGYPLGHFLLDEKKPAIVRLDPHSGRQTILHVLGAGSPTLNSISHDPFRQRIQLKQSDTVKELTQIDAQGTLSSLPVDWPHNVYEWAPTGDGRIYLLGRGEAAGRPLGYLDEHDVSHDLLGIDGDLQRMPLTGSPGTGLIHDLGTDSLFLAESQGAATVVYKLPLTPDGTRLRAPVESVVHDAYGGASTEVLAGLSAGPFGSLFLKIDVNDNADGVLMFTVDPVTLRFLPFATLTGFTAASVAASYNSSSLRAVEATALNNTQFETVRLRAFSRSAVPQSGEALAEYSSGLAPTAVSDLISIGDTVNRSYRMTVELDNLAGGGTVHGIAGERLRLHGTAYLRASHPGVTGWSLALRGDGAGVRFGFDPCDAACASSLTFVRGTDEVASNDPALITGAGGSGITDHVTLRSGVALSSRRVKVLRFWVEVTVPDSQSGEVVSLALDDSLLEGGMPTGNSITSGGRTFTPEQGIFLGNTTFTVKNAELVSLPSTHTFTLTQEAPLRVFRLDPPAANALRLRLIDHDPQAANALYFSQGRSLLPGRFELAADKRLRPSQLLAAWTLRNEPVFVQCLGTRFPDGSNEVELQLEGKLIALESLSADRGSGRMEVAIRGAGFSDGAQFQLLPQAGGPPILPSSLIIISSGRAEASFDLNGAPGVHDLRVDSPGGASDVLTSVLEVVESRTGPVIEAKISSLRAYRPGRESRLTLEYRNAGDQEALAPLFKVVGPPGIKLRLEHERVSQLGELLVLGIHPGGIPGRIPPGGTGQISIILSPESCPVDCDLEIELQVLRRTDELIAWSTLPPLAGMNAGAWEQARLGLFRRLGASWNRYAARLADLATRLSRRGVQTASVLELNRFAVREALSRPSAAVTGRLTLAGSGAPLVDAVVVVLDGGVSAASTVSDSLGEFAVDWLEGGRTYELAVDGHAVVGTANGRAQLAVPSLGDLHHFDLAVREAAQGAGPGCANCNEQNLPVAPLHPPASLFEPVARRPLRVVSSWDPNDKNGSDELGDPVPPDEQLEYAIYFENEAGKATAPAQEIVITDRLDPEKFDLGTFEIADVRLGTLPYQFLSLRDQAFVLGSGYTAAPSRERYAGNDAFLATTVVEDQGDLFTLEQQIAVRWALDRETGEATWRIRTDSQDALAGVLPVNDATGRGEGHVSFAIKPLGTLSEGAVIDNLARIQFDDNPTLATRAWVNVIQRTALAAPELPRPLDHAAGIDPATLLQWNAAGAEVFDVFLWRLGEVRPAVPLQVASRFLRPGSLDESATYQWQVVARTQAGGSVTGPVWLFTVRPPAVSPPFLRGDVNADGGNDISDALYLLRFLFTGGVAPGCLASADANADGMVDVSDAITILLALFVTGEDLPSPYPDCGVPPEPRVDVEECSELEVCR